MRFRQNIPIQPVASDCSRVAPVGQLLAAVDDGDVVEAEEAALEDVVALAVHPVHPPGEVDEQLVEAALEEGPVGLCPSGCGPCCRRARPPRRARAGSGRRTPTRRRGSGRSGAGTARRAASRAAPWRTRGPRGPGVTAWKARSQAANHGYSHLSGMEMTRIELRWRQWPLRHGEAGGGRRPARVVAVEPPVDVEEVDLLAPEQAGEGLPLHELLVGGWRLRAGWPRRTRRPRLAAPPRCGRRRRGARASRSSLKRRRRVTRPPAGTTNR